MLLRCSEDEADDATRLHMLLRSFSQLSVQKMLIILFRREDRRATVPSDATHKGSWRAADLVGDGVDAKILPLGTIKSLKGGECRGCRVRGSKTLSLK